MNSITVLITGAGAPGAPGIIKSLRLNAEREINIIGVDCNVDESVGIGLVDKYYQVPKADDHDFINEVLSVCIKEKVDVIIPLVTKELFKFAKERKQFNDNSVQVLVSDFEQLEVVNNKYELFKFCRENGIPVPDFYLVKTLGDFIQKASLLGYPNNQICFKPPVSNGLRGFRIINDSQDKMDNLIFEKPNNIYIGFKEFIQIAEDASYFPELLLMEYLSGVEYSVDMLMDHGTCHAVIPRTRDKIKMGISFVGSVIFDEEIINYSKKIGETLNLHGNIGLQFRRNISGIPKVIESNPRVQGTIILATACGYNMVYNAVKIALGESIQKPDIKWNTKMIRFWDELFFYNDSSFKL
jgi:carbamoyl-phosphate synthase large subunit